MATREEFIDKLMLIHQKKKQIQAIQLDRQEKEAEIALRYKVNECNAERNTLAVNNANAQAVLYNEIKQLESEI